MCSEDRVVFEDNSIDLDVEFVARMVFKKTVCKIQFSHLKYFKMILLGIKIYLFNFGKYYFTLCFHYQHCEPFDVKNMTTIYIYIFSNIKNIKIYNLMN